MNSIAQRAGECIAIFALTFLAACGGGDSGGPQSTASVGGTGMDTGKQDFRLLSSSPAIDAARSLGSPARDIAGARRPQGAGVDIGAFESF